MIKVLKLLSGEEIIAKVVKNSEYGCQCEDPFVFMIGPQGPVLMPFMFSADTNEVFIPAASILVGPIDPKMEVSEQYSKMTGKIMLAEHQIHLPN